jgi:hypothetical protein
MQPTAFQKMRANRGELQPRAAAPARLDLLRANRRKAGEAAARALVRRINRIEDDMAAEWHAELRERQRAMGFDDTADRLRAWSEQARPPPVPPPHPMRIAWWIATRTAPGLLALGIFTGAIVSLAAIPFIR